MNILRPLSPHLPRFRNLLFSLVILASLLLLLYLICVKIGLIWFFFDLLTRCGFSLGGRALSFPLRGLGCCCSAGLALTVGFALRALLTGEDFTHMMIPFGEGTSGASSSESPATPSDSLLGHASSETDSEEERFFTPPQSVSSGSSSSTSTPGIDSSPNNGENKEWYSFTYINPGSEEHEAMKESILRIARDKLLEWEVSGKIDNKHIQIPNEELAKALNLELVQTNKEMERIQRQLLELEWPQFETAPAGASYAGLLDLLGPHRRNTGF